MPLKYFCIPATGDRFKRISFDKLAGERGLLQNLYDNPPPAGETKTKEDELLTTINLKETG